MPVGVDRVEDSASASRREVLDEDQALEEQTHLVLGLVAGRVGVEVELHAFGQRLQQENASLKRQEISSRRELVS